jgi:hypothetical protein
MVIPKCQLIRRSWVQVPPVCVFDTSKSVQDLWVVRSNPARVQIGCYLVKKNCPNKFQNGHYIMETLHTKQVFELHTHPGQCLHFPVIEITLSSHLHNSIAVIALETLHPGGIRTRVFYFSGGCDDHCATPPGLTFLLNYRGSEKRALHSKISRVNKKTIRIFLFGRVGSS